MRRRGARSHRAMDAASGNAESMALRVSLMLGRGRRRHAAPGLTRGDYSLKPRTAFALRNRWEAKWLRRRNTRLAYPRRARKERRRSSYPLHRALVSFRFPQMVVRPQDDKS